MHRNLLRRVVPGLVALALAACPAAAHEYWIAPSDFTPAVGETVEARLLVGEMMKGTELPWLTHQIASMDVAAGSAVTGIEGLEGDLPAISFAADEPGLHVVAHTTHPLTVRFDTMAEFEEYLAYEGLSRIADRHRERGLPESRIVESYVRSAKALVQVGPVEQGDADRPLGLPFELVALANPYAGGDTLAVRLLWQGKPEAGTQIAVFRERGGDVERTLVRTEADGGAEIPLGGGGLFLLNAVHIEPIEGETHSWASIWASLTFGLPAGP